MRAAGHCGVIHACNEVISGDQEALHPPLCVIAININCNEIFPMIPVNITDTNIVG